MRLYTNSELKTYKRCERKWWLTYYRRLGLKRESTVSAAALGTLVHLGLEVIYTPADKRDPIEVVRERTAHDILELQSELGEDAVSRVAEAEKQRDLAIAMLTGYIEWLEAEGEDFDLEILSAEASIEVPIYGLPGYGLLGKLDLHVRRKTDGAILALDHKTVQTFSDRTALANMDEQLLHYHLIEHLAFISGKIDERADGSILNMLRKVKRTGTSKPPFYSRVEVHHNLDQLRAHWRHVMAVIVRIQQATADLDAGADPHLTVIPNVTRDCTWDCPFKPICPMFDDGSDPEFVIQMSYMERDPLARYEDTEEV